MKLRDDAMQGDAGEMSPAQLTPEQLAELLEKSAEIDLDALMEGDLDATTGMFMSNLMKEAGTPSSEKDGKSGEPTTDDSTGSGDGEEPLKPIVTIYYYDEWDFRAQDYKPRWCAVKESKLEEGADNFYEDTLHEHAGLVAQTRKQFELMKPEMFRKLKRLPDGEDFVGRRIPVGQFKALALVGECLQAKLKFFFRHRDAHQRLQAHDDLRRVQRR